MTALLHSQYLQVRTLRSTYGVAGALIAIVAAVGGFVSNQAGDPDLLTAQQLREPLAASGGIMVAVVLAVLAAGRVAGEYRHGTIAQRALAAPARARMIGSALLAHGAFAALVSVVAFAIGAAVAAVVLGPTEYSNGLAGAELASTTGAVVLAGVSFTVMGAALGFGARSQIGATSTVFGVFFAEKLFGSVLGDAAGYLPYSLLNSLLDLDGPLPEGVAAVALSAWALAAAGVAVVLARRRDLP
jgi:ABC-type transport system involved in multi-copper enzyme maturation permease subunit